MHRKGNPNPVHRQGENHEAEDALDEKAPPHEHPSHGVEG